MGATSIRGLTISVGYDDLLAVTLVRNMRHLARCLVITSPEDERTQAVARSVPGVEVFVTDAFTRHGARFNKGLAFEEAFDHWGRSGWMLIWDADCLFPDEIPFGRAELGSLWGMRRRILADPTQWHDGFDWSQAEPSQDGNAPIGFFQLFHGDDPAIRDRRPWYEPTFAHAGGGDAYFLQLWGPAHRRMLGGEVLHLGPRDTNWFGRSSPRLDGQADPEAAARREVMDAFLLRNGWTRTRKDIDRTAVERVAQVPHRVQVPGVTRTDYELPFVRRAAGRQR